MLLKYFMCYIWEQGDEDLMEKFYHVKKLNNNFLVKTFVRIANFGDCIS